MKSAKEDNIQLTRLRGQMELRCLCKCLLKHLMVRRFLRESGREFQIDDAENARPILYRSMRGSGWIKLLEPYLFEDLVKSERMYSGVFPLHTLNIITALLYFSCSVNRRSLKDFTLSSLGINGFRERVCMCVCKWIYC